MATMTDGRKRRAAPNRGLSGLWLLLWLCVFAAGARAEQAGVFYQSDAIVTGTDMRQRPWGFAQCLRDVLVKVSGDPRLRNDPRVLALANDADRYVASFDYVDLMAHLKRNDDQGSYDRPHRLTVRFDPVKIDAVLGELGDTPWRGERPVVVPILMVSGPKSPPYLLTAETPCGADQSGDFVNVSIELGIEIRVPSEAEIAGLSEAGEKPGAAIVIGTLDWNEALPGWVGKWRMRWHGVEHEWGIRGVNYDAAFRDIVGGVVELASGRGKPD
jgi:uncharacterized protein